MTLVLRPGHEDGWRLLTKFFLLMLQFNLGCVCQSLSLLRFMFLSRIAAMLEEASRSNSIQHNQDCAKADISHNRNWLVTATSKTMMEYWFY